jgi:hypothetical protein
MPRKIRSRPLRLRQSGGGTVVALPLNLMRPDSEVQDRLPLRELPPRDLPPGGHTRLYGTEYVRYWLLGDCTVIVTRGEQDGWHLSIAHHSRYPTWDEISQARYRLLPNDLWFCLYMPPPGNYVNLHKNCFQVIECPPRPEL